MNPAATYNRRFAWSVRSLGGPNTFGKKPDVYTPSGYLWGAFEDHTSGTRRFMETDQADPRATVRLRNYPTVRPLDRLTDEQFGDVWEVREVRRGDNELVLEVGPVENAP